MSSSRRPRRAAAQRPAEVLGSSAAETLPHELWELIGAHLFCTIDELNNIATMAHDVAALALTSKALDKLAQAMLWPLLGRTIRRDRSTIFPRALGSGPWYGFWEHDQLKCKTRPMEKRFREISRREVADIYERLDVPGAVPHHIFHEVVRMNYIGLVASNARAVFLLTDGELAALPFVRHDRGTFGTATLYALPDVLQLARRKYGSSVAALKAARQAKKDAAAKREQEKKDTADRRREELRAVLEPFSIELSAGLLSMTMVKEYLQKRHPPVPLPGMVALLRLIQFADRQGGYYTRVLNHVNATREFDRDSEEMNACMDYSFWRYMHFSDRTDGPMRPQEEREVVWAAVQRWAEVAGGAEAAVQRAPEALREPIREAMTKELGTEVKHWAPSASLWEEW